LPGSTEFAAVASLLTGSEKFAAAASLLAVASEVSTASSPPHPLRTQTPDASRKNRIELSIRKFPKKRGSAAIIAKISEPEVKDRHGEGNDLMASQRSQQAMQTSVAFR
jgi:hypothetical protein